MEAVFTRWEELVGAELGEHVRPVRVDGRALVVAVDHPAWATRARMESGQILARLKALGDSPIERLEVVVERS
jgi:predicted nucleic acid-binding Zn ribbon protein